MAQKRLSSLRWSPQKTPPQPARRCARPAHARRRYGGGLGRKRTDTRRTQQAAGSWRLGLMLRQAASPQGERFGGTPILSHPVVISAISAMVPTPNISRSMMLSTRTALAGAVTVPLHTKTHRYFSSPATPEYSRASYGEEYISSWDSSMLVVLHLLPG